jgi:hypothetical protein
VTSFLVDLKHGLRILARSPGFAGMAIVTLALGIGAASAIFSVVSGVILKPLPFHEPDRIVAIFETNSQTNAFSTSEANFLDMRKQSRSLSDVAALRFDTAIRSSSTSSPCRRTCSRSSASRLHAAAASPRPTTCRAIPPSASSSPTRFGARASAAIPTSSVAASVSTRSRTPSPA